MRNQKIVFITQAAMIAAIYVVLTYVFAPISYGEIQVRIAEALTILPFFTPAAIPGLFIGCLLGNLLSSASMLDVVFGSLATLLGACMTYGLRKNKFLAPIGPILSNALIVPFILKYGYGVALPIWMMMITVGIGQAIAAGLLGMLLLFTLEKYKHIIFKTESKKS